MLTVSHAFVCMLKIQLKRLETSRATEPCTEIEPSECVLDWLAAHVEASLNELDAVFLEGGLAGSYSKNRRGQVEIDANGAEYLKVVDTYALPFDVHTTGATMWKLLSSRSLNIGSGAYQAVAASGDSVRAHFGSTVTLSRQDVMLRMHVVAKRLVEGKREVVVWCFTTSDSNGCLDEGESAQMQGCGWTIIECAPSGNGGSECEDFEPPSVVQSVVQTTFDLGSDQSTNEDVVTDAVLRAFGQHFDRLHQLIENHVLSNSFMS